MISLQRHKERYEVWAPISDSKVIKNEEILDLKEGGYVVISKGEKHRLMAVGDVSIVTEISAGFYDQNDIERLEDKYGRV